MKTVQHPFGTMVQLQFHEVVCGCVASFTERMTLTAAPMMRIIPYHRGSLQLLARAVNQTCNQK